MKIDFKVIIILALLLALILSIIFWPKPQPGTDEKALEDSTQVYKAREREAIKLQIDIARKLRDNRVKDSVSLKRFEIENKRLRIRIANIKPRVDSILIKNPSVDSLVRTQDSLIIVQASRIDSLDVQRMIMAKSYTYLVASKDEQIFQLKNINKNMDEIVALKNKDLRRARRGSRWLKVAVPVVGVGMFILGSQ